MSRRLLQVLCPLLLAGSVLAGCGGDDLSDEAMDQSAISSCPYVNARITAAGDYAVIDFTNCDYNSSAPFRISAYARVNGYWQSHNYQTGSISRAVQRCSQQRKLVALGDAEEYLIIARIKSNCLGRWFGTSARM